MAATRIHLVRHGEVHNPDRILYGRLTGFTLTPLGRRMADAAAAALDGAPVTALYASPLQRAQESAEPWAQRFGLEVRTEERIIEPTNSFEGKTFEFGPGLIVRPQTWPLIRNPFKPSWGEPFAEIAERVIAAMNDAWDAAADGEVVMVSHQSPIWIAHRAIAGQRLWHDPRARRCSLSSITSFERRDGRFVEVNYQDPARELLDASVDLGAV